MPSMTKRYKQAPIDTKPAPQLAAPAIDPDAPSPVKAPELARKAMGRPPTRLSDPEKRQALLDLIAQGMTITEIAQLPGMPSAADVAAEQARDSNFSDAVTRARTHGAHWLAERGLAIVDSVDVTSPTVKNDLYKAKLRCDARFKLAAAWSPREFGSKAEPVNITNQSVQLQLDPHQLRVLAQLAIRSLSNTSEADAAPLQLATPKER